MTARTTMTRLGQAIGLGLALAACSPIGVSGNYHIFHRPEDEILDRLKGGAPAAATAVLREEEAYFTAALAEGDADVAASVDSLRQAHAARREAACAPLRQTVPDGFGVTDWARYKAALADCGAAIDDGNALAARLEAIAHPGAVEDARSIAEDAARRASARAALTEFAPRQFLDHAVPLGLDFASAYPVAVDLDALVPALLSEAMDRLKVAPYEPTSSFLGRYGRFLDADRRAWLIGALWDRACDGRSDDTPSAVVCKAREIAEDPLFDAPFLRRHVPFAIATDGDGQGAVRLRVHWRSFAPYAGNATGKRFVLTIGPGEVTRETKTVGYEGKKGKYQSGTQRVPNPEYEKLEEQIDWIDGDLSAARNELEWARREYETCLSDPARQDTCNDWRVRRATSDVERFARDQEVLRNDLLRTDTMIDEPVYRSYRYTRTDKRHVTAATFPVRFEDTAGGPTWTTFVTTVASSDFAVYRGLREDDLNYRDVWFGDDRQPAPDETIDQYDFLARLSFRPR